MTPQERQLVDELFDRLARLETAPRDAEAERAIAEDLSRAPHAVYALVQTVLVQDEALRRADARIRELTGEDEPASQGGGFLDNMRNTIMGRPANASVPSVRPGAANEPDPRWNSGGTGIGGGGYGGGPAGPSANAAPQGSPWQGGGGGPSFLGTAAASAVGTIGGALLFNSISSMFGGHRGGSALADAAPAAATSPWDNSASGSDLARDAGVNDVGAGAGASSAPGSAGLFDAGNTDNTDVADASDDFGDDLGGGDFGDSDNA